MEELEIRRESKKLIPGVEILRFYMCFMVVCSHLGGKALFELGGMFYIFQAYHVPVFMLLSFILCGHYFLEPTGEKILKRILRILIPFFVWGVLGYLLCLILWPLTFDVFGWQLIGGYPINTPLWYLASTLWISLIFWLIRKLTNKKIFIVIIIVLSVASIVLQYTGLNYQIFGSIRYELKDPLGTTVEMIPYASLGVILSMFVPFITKQKFKVQLLICGIAALSLVALLTFKYIFKIGKPQSFNYSGILSIFMAFFLVVTAFTNPINFVRNKVVLGIIKWTTSFTMGVFCMHVVIGRFIQWAFLSLNWPVKNVIFALTTYIVCYLISLLIYLIPNKYIRMTVN